MRMVAQPKDLDLNDAPARASELFLIDGNSLAYRAFFALPEELATSDGFPTGALLGFANMLMRLLGDYRPRGVIAAWDTKPVHRLERFPGYKASRRPTPDLMRQQQPHLRPLVEAFGYRNVELEGYEADDVIGTLARRAEERGIPTCVISHDRDAFQLVSEHVCVLLSPRGVTDVHVYTPERVRARYGIGPELIPDLIGLKGDPSDDIPGVPGIGDKTASDLLQRFGSVEGVLANLPAVPGEKRRELLATHADDVRKSRELATIERDLPLDVDLDAALAGSPDRATMKETFRRFEFRGLLRRLDELEEAVPAAHVERTGVAVAWRDVDAEGLRGFLAGARQAGVAADAAGRFALARDGEVAIALIDPTTLAMMLEGVEVAAHDLKAASQELAATPGLSLDFDSVVAGYLLDPGRADYLLGDLLEEAAVDLQIEGDEADAALVRAAAGAERLRAPMTARLEDRELDALLRRIELPLVEVLASMELAGIAVDAARMGELAHRVSDQVAELEERAAALAGGPFQIGSPKQLGEVLFERLGLASGRKGKTGYSTDAKVLARIRDAHRDRSSGRGMARALETARHLSAAVRRPARRRRAAAHDLLADDGVHRTALGAEAEPAEHPDPDAARARDPRNIHRRRGLTPPVCRLRPGRAADPRAPVGRGAAAGRVRARRGHPPRDGGRGARKARRSAHQGRARSCEGGQLRDHLRDLVVWPVGAARDRARGGAGLHRSLSRSHAARRGVHRGCDRDGARGGLFDDPARPTAPRARAACPELERALARASGSRSTR